MVVTAVVASYLWWWWWWWCQDGVLLTRGSGEVSGGGRQLTINEKNKNNELYYIHLHM